MKVSRHGKMRMRERTPFNHKERTTLFKKALTLGKAPYSIKNEELKQYLYSKEKYNSKVKLYNGYVFIHSKNAKRLYTMYELPEKYKGEE